VTSVKQNSKSLNGAGSVIKKQDSKIGGRKTNMLDFIEVNTHSSIKIIDKKIIYVDPFQITNELHDADIILITHEHFDHYSTNDICKVMKSDTVIVYPESMEDTRDLGLTEKRVNTCTSFSVYDIKMQTVPAYNNFKFYHLKRSGWVGYIIDSEQHGRIYIAGDTDIHPINKAVKCRIAMLPIGGTYTMNAKQAAEFANILKPEYVIPIHYGNLIGSFEDADIFASKVNEGIKTVIKITG